MRAAKSSEMVTAQIFSLRSEAPGLMWFFFVPFFFFMSTGSYSFSDFSKRICSMVRAAMTSRRMTEAAEPRP